MTQLVLRDFGYGIQRYDLGSVSLLENIDSEGNYRGNHWACEFNFKLLEFLRSLDKFLEQKESEKH